MSRGLLAALASLCVGCQVGIVDGGSSGTDDDEQPSCTPPDDDGVCTVDLSCGPDIDCMLVFDDQSQAEAWFGEIEVLLAASENRAPRTILPVSSFAKYQDLLARGWEAYQAVKPVGLLAEHQPYLIVIDDPGINAFVVAYDPASEAKKPGFAVMMQTGLLESGMTDEEVMAVVFHELEHALGLHGVDNSATGKQVKSELRRHYAAAASEPFGFEQDNDTRIADAMDRWRLLAGEITAHNRASLGGLPLGANTFTNQVFRTVVTNYAEATPACQETLGQLDQLYSTLNQTYSGISQTFDWTMINEEALTDLTSGELSLLADVRDDCLASFELSYIDVLAAINDTSAETIRAQMSSADLALTDGVHFVDGSTAIIAARRASMRAIESEFAAAYNVPWSQARVYTHEEAADDVTVPILDAMGLPIDTMAYALAKLDPPEVAQECADEYITPGIVPPYGTDLTDDHHGNCFRVAHIHQLAESGRLTDDASARLALPSGDPSGLDRLLADDLRPLPAPQPEHDIEVMY